jgi:hypothetical protein
METCPAPREELESFGMKVGTLLYAGSLGLALALLSRLAQGPASDPAEIREGGGAAAPRAGALDTSGAHVHRDGSQVPCDVPMGWRVARVDPEFGWAAADVGDALRAATSLWEEALDRDLFVEGAPDGHPIRLMFDHRRGASVAPASSRTAGDSIGLLLQARSDEQRVRREAHAAERLRHESWVQDLDARITKHNEAVRALNSNGRTSGAVEAALRAEGDRLAQERDSLRAAAEALGQTSRGLDEEWTMLEADVSEHRSRVAQGESAADGEDEAGVYREAVWQLGGETKVSREIRVFASSSLEQLRLIIAHELGHALGLVHSNEPGALMGAVHGGPGGVGGWFELPNTDRTALLEVCPELGHP